MGYKQKVGETPAEARNRYMREWRAKNPVRVRGIKHISFLKHRDKVLATVRAYRDEHRDEVRARNRDYSRHRRDRSKHQARSREYYEANREEILEKRKEYQETHRVERAAQARARRNVPITVPCSRCGETVNLGRHHPDYSKPLEVEIECKSCHGQDHSEYPSDHPK